MLAFGVTAPALGLAAALAGGGIPAQAASAAHYVALCDSYSSGVGAGSTSGSCGQSPSAYPALWATANAAASFTFAACSGAKTSDVISSQLSSLSASTTLVSITIGGNDAGFSSIMETCVLKSTSSCESAVASGEQFVNSTLPGQLNTTLADIRAHAPNAKIVVLDYPDFYDLNAKFCGHELCDGAGWLNSVTLPIGNSYHPTATGQKSGYLPVFSAAAAKVGQ